MTNDRVKDEEGTVDVGPKMQQRQQLQKEFISKEEQDLRIKLEQEQKAKDEEMMRQHEYIKYHQKENELNQKSAKNWDRMFGSRPQNKSWSEWMKAKIDAIRGKQLEPKFIDLDTVD